MYVVLVVYTSGDIYIYMCIYIPLLIHIQLREHILSMYVGLAVYRVLYIHQETCVYNKNKTHMSSVCTGYIYINIFVTM